MVCSYAGTATRHLCVTRAVLSFVPHTVLRGAEDQGWKHLQLYCQAPDNDRPSYQNLYYITESQIENQMSFSESWRYYRKFPQRREVLASNSDIDAFNGLGQNGNGHSRCLRLSPSATLRVVNDPCIGGVACHPIPMAVDELVGRCNTGSSPPKPQRQQRRKITMRWVP